MGAVAPLPPSCPHPVLHWHMISTGWQPGSAGMSAHSASHSATEHPGQLASVLSPGDTGRMQSPLGPYTPGRPLSKTQSSPSVGPVSPPVRSSVLPEDMLLPHSGPRAATKTSSHVRLQFPEQFSSIPIKLP
mmetsp:Transcript_9999/g.24975  ORF Transcript_9999/g.24975 Transcript_9999/m.24975 type:complete len:132 (-) Transcript_9999:488-883(-)